MSPRSSILAFITPLAYGSKYANSFISTSPLSYRELREPNDSRPLTFSTHVRSGAGVTYKDVREMVKIDTRFVKQVSGTSLKTATFAYYKSKKGGYVLKPKRGRTSTKDPVAVALNRYAKANVGASTVSMVYASKSKVLRSTENLLAVKLKGGAKGWITEKGKFMSEEQLRNVLKSVDATSPAAVAGVSLQDIYDSLSPQKKAEFADRVRDFDWDQMFAEMYPKDGVAEADTQMDAYLELLTTLGDLKGWQRGR